MYHNYSVLVLLLDLSLSRAIVRGNIALQPKVGETEPIKNALQLFVTIVCIYTSCVYVRFGLGGYIEWRRSYVNFSLIHAKAGYNPPHQGERSPYNGTNKPYLQGPIKE